MKREIIHEEYSYDRLYRFIVCRESDYFEVWVQKKITDEYLDPEEIYFSDIPVLFQLPFQDSRQCV